MELCDGALSLIFLILERITRDTHNKVIKNPQKESKIHWDKVLQELENYFQKHKGKQKELDAIKLTKDIKDKGKRNKHQHADSDAILKEHDVIGLKIDIKTKEVEPHNLNLNSKIIPPQIQVQAKHKIICTEVYVFLGYYLPHIIKALHKYQTWEKELMKRESGGRDSNPRKIGLQPIAVAAVPPPHAPDRIRTCDLLLSSAVKTAD